MGSHQWGHLKNRGNIRLPANPGIPILQVKCNSLYWCKTGRHTWQCGYAGVYVRHVCTHIWIYDVYICTYTICIYIYIYTYMCVYSYNLVQSYSWMSGMDQYLMGYTQALSDITANFGISVWSITWLINVQDRMSWLSTQSYVVKILLWSIPVV